MRAGSYRQPFLFGILMFVNTARHGPFRVAVPLEREVLPGRLRHPGFDPAGASPSMPCTMVDDARIGQEPLTVMSEQKNELLTTSRKALAINLDETRYGTFAEIGAGQEVVRRFFQAGGASGTIAKTISAYDMVFSDAIYGKAPPLRLAASGSSTMLDHEYRLIQERLAASAASRHSVLRLRRHRRHQELQGRQRRARLDGHPFSGPPREPPNDIILHVRMWDKEAVLQQEALGIVGVNFIYGAFFYRHDPPEVHPSHWWTTSAPTGSRSTC